MDFQHFKLLLEGITSKEVQTLQILSNYRLTEAQQQELFEDFNIDIKTVEKVQGLSSEFGFAQMEMDIEDEFQLNLDVAV